jgi:hypothetical protein
VGRATERWERRSSRVEPFACLAAKVHNCFFGSKVHNFLENGEVSPAGLATCVSLQTCAVEFEFLLSCGLVCASWASGAKMWESAGCNFFNLVLLKNNFHKQTLRKTYSISGLARTSGLLAPAWRPRFTKRHQGRPAGTRLVP